MTDVSLTIAVVSLPLCRLSIGLRHTRDPISSVERLTVVLVYVLGAFALQQTAIERVACYAYMHVHMYVCMYVCMYASICMYVSYMTVVCACMHALRHCTALHFRQPPNLLVCHHP